MSCKTALGDSLKMLRPMSTADSDI